MSTSNQCPCCKQVLANHSDLIVDPDSGTIIRNGMAVILPPTEFDLFFKLYEQRGSVFDKETLYRELYWNRHGDADVEIKIVDVFICKIRKQISAVGIQITTHWGRGYSLNIVSEIQEAA